MCRNIKTLYHFEPPATEEEVRASALQYVRKLSGLKSFSKKNKEACEHAVEHITEITMQLFRQLETHGQPRSREIELSDEHVEYRWMTRAACARVSLAPGYVGALEQFWRAVDA